MHGSVAGQVFPAVVVEGDRFIGIQHIRDHEPVGLSTKSAMKALGLLGGMSWESTVPYYRIVNETVRERLGGSHSAKVVL